MSDLDEAYRVLLVEDDADVRRMIGLLLGDEGCEVFGVVSGEEALEVLDRVDPDAALVDVRLPGMDGIEVVRAVRARSDVPIVVVTAQSDSADVVAGLDAGADDYVTKPFDPDVLLARLRAVLRRVGPVSDEADEHAIGSLVIRPQEAEVFVRGEKVVLTKTELRLLVTLAEADGAVLSRQELLERVWRYDYLGDSRMVDAHVRRLRLKIEEEPAEPRMLVTVRGLGYRLVSDGESSSA